MNHKLSLLIIADILVRSCISAAWFVHSSLAYDVAEKRNANLFLPNKFSSAVPKGKCICLNTVTRKAC